jgi:hypothetical protein
MEKYIHRKFAADDPWSVLKNLFHRPMCGPIACDPPKRGRKPKWLDDFTDNKHIKNVILSPSADTVYDYAKHNADMTPLYKTLITFYTNKGFDCVGDIDFFSSHSRQIQQHLILSMMTMMLLEEDEMHLKKIYFVLSDDDNWFLGYIRGNVDTKGRVVPAYKLLNERRLFAEDGMGFTGNIWDSKEMLCETPIWRERFEKFGDDEEKFCEMYDYQPDDYCRRVIAAAGLEYTYFSNTINSEGTFG